MVREDTFVRAEIRHSRQGWLVMIAVSDLLPSLLDALIFDEVDNTHSSTVVGFSPHERALSSVSSSRSWISGRRNRNNLRHAESPHQASQARVVHARGFVSN